MDELWLTGVVLCSQDVGIRTILVAHMHHWNNLKMNNDAKPITNRQE
jgi:hypothetical protein